MADLRCTNLQSRPIQVIVVANWITASIESSRAPCQWFFQDAPATLDWVVLPMIGWIVGQTHRQAGVVGKIHHAPHALGPSTMVLRAII